MARRKRQRVWVVVILLIACVAGALWFAGREPVLRWLAEYAVEKSDGKLALQGVQGSLYGPIHIAALVFETSESRIEAHGLELDWSPRDIVLHKQVRVQTLRAQTLTLVVKQPSTEPLQFPHTLRLPLGLEIPAATVERLVVESGGQRHEFALLKLTLKNPEDEYRVAAAIDTPWGKGDATISLGAVLPYTLSGQARISRAEQPHPYTLSATLSGNLAEIRVSATGNSGTAQGTVKATLTPFHSAPLQQATLHAQHINPQQFWADLPQADFGVDVTLQTKSPNVFQGVVKIANTTPGTVDDSRVPLKELQTAFEGTLDSLAFSAIQMDLGEAGQFAGAGGVQQGRLNFDLTTTGLNLRGVHSTLKSTRLAGKVHLGVEGATQIVRADLGQEQYRIELDAVHRDAAVEIKTARISSAGSELALHGTLALAQAREFHAEGTLRRFDPARFGNYPAASINARFTAQGQLMPALQAALQVSIADSHYRNKLLSGKGAATVSLQRVWNADVALRLGADRLSAQGAFGAPGDALSWRLGVADMGALAGPRFGGRIAASGTLEGTLGQPAGTFEISAENLNWDDAYHLARLSATGRLDQGLDGPLALKMELRAYRSAGLEIEQASLNAKGQRNGHKIELAARNTMMDMRSVLTGGWQGENGWVGELQRFENRGRFPVALNAPAKLLLGRTQFSLTDAALGVAGGTVRVGELARRDSRFYSHGTLETVSGAELLKLADRPLNIETTLVLNGKWTLVAADKINAEVALWREQGDVTMLTEPPTVLGLSRFAVQITAVDNQLSATLDVAGSTLGFVTTNMQSTLTRKGDAWGMSGDTTLSLQADAGMPSIAWAAPLLGKHVEIDGAAKVRLHAQGTVREPKLTGEVMLENFSFDYPEYGIGFKQGSLLASMRDNRLLIDRFELRGGEGDLSGNGSIAWGSGKPDMKIALVANKLEVLSRPDRLLILSGSGEASVREGRVNMAAKLKADRGLIELPEADAPSLSEDVIVLGRSDAAEKKKTPYAIVMDVELDLGEQFYLKGKGVDAQLTGAVKVRAIGEGVPTATGIIRVAKGDYSAYGQRLSIERGILNFAGPIDNPGLNIVALRKNLPVEVGVAISGTAQLPQVRLTSVPSVPDSEKLSWLVLGHGLENTSGGEFSLLQAAAGALLAQGESVSLETRIAHAAGLDEFALSGKGEVESTVLTLGKRLSTRAYLSFEQGLTGASNLAKINYTLTQRLSVRAQTGTESAMDLFYTFSFD